MFLGRLKDAVSVLVADGRRLELVEQTRNATQQQDKKLAIINQGNILQAELNRKIQMYQEEAHQILQL